MFTTESGTATKIENTQNTLKSGTAKHMFCRTTAKSGTALAVLAVLVAPRLNQVGQQNIAYTWIEERCIG